MYQEAIQDCESGKYQNIPGLINNANYYINEV